MRARGLDNQKSINNLLDDWNFGVNLDIAWSNVLLRWTSNKAGAFVSIALECNLFWFFFMFVSGERLETNRLGE